MTQERGNGESSDRSGVWRTLRALMDALASTRTAVVLLAAIAAATMVATVLPDDVAGKYVYGGTWWSAWFCVLLGLLGVNLVACMVWRRRIGMVRIWSLLTHLGIFLVLAGAMVTLVFAERGWITIYERQELAEYLPAETVRGKATYSAATRTLTDPAARFVSGGVSAGATVGYWRGAWRVRSVEGETSLVLTRGPPSDITEPVDYAFVKPLGFTLRLVDFRLVHYPPADYLHVIRAHAELAKLRVTPGEALDIPGTTWRFAPIGFLPPNDGALVEVTMPDGTGRLVPAEAGTEHALADDTALRVFRYEPSFKIDVRTKRVTSDSGLPKNPALQVELVRGGKGSGAWWLFANPEHQGHDRSPGRRDEKIKLRYLHPGWPSLLGELQGSSGSMGVRIECNTSVYTPWDTELVLGYTRDSLRIKEFESEVEVLADGRVVRRHIIRVNSPLVHEGIKLSQSAYDKDYLRYTVLGVTRDKGVWIVYAGFLAAMLGVMGRFYLRPILRGMRAKSTREGGDDGSS